MSKPKISKAKAEKTLVILREMFPDAGESMWLASHEHEDRPPGCWSIAWEGSGRDCWPFEASEAQFENPATFPVGVFVEPRTSWCLGLYPAG